MYSNMVDLKKHINHLEEIISKSKNRIPDAPEGRLEVVMKNNHARYYQCVTDKQEGKRKRIYLGADNIGLAKGLAQKAYDEMIIKEGEKQLKLIEVFANNLDRKKLEKIYESYPAERKALITSDVISDKEYIEQWEAVTYNRKGFEPGAPEYYTNKGERVRSKSEKIIADTLFNRKIPYRYEPPLLLSNGKTWHPDFVLLNIDTRKEIILEHLGMMDNPEYSNSALRKIKIYIQNNIFPGDGLIITAESKGVPLSTTDLEKILDHYI